MKPKSSLHALVPKQKCWIRLFHENNSEFDKIIRRSPFFKNPQCCANVIAELVYFMESLFSWSIKNKDLWFPYLFCKLFHYLQHLALSSHGHKMYKLFLLHRIDSRYFLLITSFLSLQKRRHLQRKTHQSDHASMSYQLKDTFLITMEHQSCKIVLW